MHSTYIDRAVTRSATTAGHRACGADASLVDDDAFVFATRDSRLERKGV